jgi:hypothetical protein
VTTGYEVQMYNDISVIAQSLRRIANCMEAGEKRARERTTTTVEDIERMGPAIRAVVEGFADLEQGVKDEGHSSGGTGHDHMTASEIDESRKGE